MKVLLVATPMSNESFDVSTITITEPLGLEYLYAGIKENHDVMILDSRLKTERSLKDAIESFQPDIVGCGATITEVYNALNVCAEAKRIDPRILTVIGGHHASVMPQDFLKDFVDVVVMGEGVHPFTKVCDYYGQKKDFADIENIYYRKNGSMVFTQKAGFPDMDTLPMPDRKATAHLRHNYRTRLLYKPIQNALMRASTGCVYKCNFCPVSALLNHKLHRRSLERVVEEYATVEEPFILWVDDEFLLDAKRAVQLAQEIERTGIQKYHFFMGRSDTIVNHPESVEAWARIGLKSVFIGLEAHRDVDLDKMQKGTSVSKHQEAINILHANGVNVRGGFIVLQDYTKDDFKKLADFSRKLGVDMPSFSICTPLPGTQLWAEKESELIVRNYNYFDMLHSVLPTHLPAKEFYKEYSTLLFKKGMTLDHKRKFLKEMKPGERWKFFKNGIRLYTQVKNGYQIYD